jgi:peptidoglycan/LPS O-acetylase OafA/YrhL
MTHKKWISGLDSLRIILAVIVLLSHLDTYSVLHAFDNPAIKIFAAIIGNTFVGVCAVIAFFIISGIVIHFPYTGQKRLDTPSFLTKRYLRLGIPMLIVYWITKLIDMPVSYLPFWSLYCELIYYTLYPIILYLLRKDKRILATLFITTFLLSYLVVLIEGNALNDLLNRNKNLNAEYWQFGVLTTAIIGLPNWLLGLIVAKKLSILSKPVSVSIRKMYLIRLVVLVISMACSIARYHLAVSYTLSLNIFGIIATYWIWMEINYWANHTPNKLLESLGKISYSVYICHALAVFLVANLLKASFFLICLEIIATFAFSLLFYRLIEKPSHKLAQKIT